MPNTVVIDDDGPPPTQPDMPAPKKGKSVWIVVVVAMLSLALGGGAAYVYLVLWKYEATALKHVPQNAAGIVHIEAKELLLFKPFREHILPALDEASKDDDVKGRLDRVKKETGIDLKQDIREVVIVTVDEETWVVLLGGQLETGKFVKGMHKVLSDEMEDAWEIEDELLIGPAGVAMGQAEDGTVVIGASERVVNASLPESDDKLPLKLPEEGAVRFAFGEAFIDGVGTILSAASGGNSPFDGVEEIRGSMTLGEEPRLDINFVPEEAGELDKIEENLDDLLSDARLLLWFVEDKAGEKQALRNAKVEQKDKTVHIGAEWPYEPLDEAAETIGKTIRSGLE